ncbi:helix-turn-helix protein [Blastomonas natatoria]|uniref:Helix-turn-helix protein n=1 Tax=Blastomonas natatoria TaxID=34015 RepID=A0A2V3V2F4_9SPHN|nr:helix-turn-helix transcriptional regulator [Blastomonas natatoria]PXW68081.1 helix-turn-helix protein [Blastomonas natatoria]
MSAGIEEIAASIREARIAKALTQKELGLRVGLPQSHISKIEKGTVDLKLSSLVEIARALELEIMLVPRKALPAVEGAVRAHGTSVETSRALSLLNEQAQIAERIKASFPDLSQVESFQHAIRSISTLQFDAARLKALDEALQPAKRLKAIIDAQGGAAALAKRLKEATSALRHFRNIQLCNAPLNETARQRPAYRLEEDDG